ncbi:MAG: ribosome biogenesis GTPase Der [bacterium]|nr:ribosome biogenesis GTPase Der [bacterium]
MPRKEIDRPKVALIGRPNVGKSTLFNRLIGADARRGGRSAIVDVLPGVTRDRLYGVVEWDGYEFTVIDSGGMGPESEDPLLVEVAENSRQAIAEADLVVMVTDGRSGISLSDEEVLKELRRAKKPTILAVNKVDSAKIEPYAAEFWGLGVEDLIMISAVSGRAVGEMLDLVVAKLDWEKWPLAIPAAIKERYGEDDGSIAVAARRLDGDDEDQEGDDSAEQAEDVDDPDAKYPFAWEAIPEARFVPDESWRGTPIRLVFVGRQNVGKSSLTNALLGEHRSLVNELPGTTRDPLYAAFEHGGQQYELLDTAGLKRVTRLKEDVDFYAMVRAERGLKGGEVALLTVDAEDGILEQDKRVASKIEELGRAVVIVVNKRDLIKLPHTESDELERKYGSSGVDDPFKGSGTAASARRNVKKGESLARSSPSPPDRATLESLYLDYIRDQLGRLRWAEVIFTSATEGSGLPELLAAAARARENFHRRIDNKALQAVLREAIALNPPPIVKNQELRFYDFRQIGNCPPAFLVEVNNKLVMRQAYRRFIERRIRRHFEFAGAHIELVIYEKRKRRKS